MLKLEENKEDRMDLGDGSILPSSTWAVLHPDLLRLIFKRLYDTFDFIHFRAVCKWWRGAAPLSDYPPQYPFYLQHEDGSTEFRLYSYTGKTRTLQVPQACGRKFSAQSQGYLIMYEYGNKYGNKYGNNNATLLNPFTRAERPLSFIGYFAEPIHVRGDPIRNVGELVMHTDYYDEQRKFVRLKENEYKEWTVGFACRPTTYYKGKLFYTERCKKTVVVDMITGTVISRIRIPNRNNDLNYLVEGPDSLFNIQGHNYLNCETTLVENRSFTVYRLDEDEKPLRWRWVKQSDIGDLMIFVNFDRGICLSASDFVGFKGNCIHFTEYCKNKNQIVVGRYDLGKDKSEMLGKVRSTGDWIVPNLY